MCLWAFRRKKYCFQLLFSCLFIVGVVELFLSTYDYDESKHSMFVNVKVHGGSYSPTEPVLTPLTTVEETFQADFELDEDYLYSHPLENFCRYPVLHKDEETTSHFVSHPRTAVCQKVLPEVVTFGEDRILRINQELALNELHFKVKCRYQGFAGALRPNVSELYNFTDVTEFYDISEKILYDQFEVKCYNVNLMDITNETTSVYKFAFSQIVRPKMKKFVKNSEDLLSIHIIGLDSTSLNMMRRHMSLTFEYFIKTMGAFHLEGYNKVSDNSMVNLIPVLAGKLYYTHDPWPSDYLMNQTLDLESVPFLWKDYAERGCATMLNDDPDNINRGLFHYRQTKGFWQNPTDHYFRPWYIYHRKYPIANSSKFCFGNKPYYELQLNLAEQMINEYKDTCHFSFSFFTNVSHDIPSDIERMDDTLKSFLVRTYTSNMLNHTALIIMGDHGHRISPYCDTFIGRIEERSPFFGIYLPEWFRHKFPDVAHTLTVNRHRLTSNFDIYETMKDILNAKFDTKFEKRRRGTSLFQKIPKNRTCYEATIGENHCLCLIKDKLRTKVGDDILSEIRTAIFDYTSDVLGYLTDYCQLVHDIDLINVEFLTTSQMIQQGVRMLQKRFFAKLQSKYVIGEVEYIQVKYRLIPTNVEATIRLQHNKKSGKIFVNVPPLVLSGKVDCSSTKLQSQLPSFCTCMQ